MPSTSLRKNLHIYFSKLKSLPKTKHISCSPPVESNLYNIPSPVTTSTLVLINSFNSRYELNISDADSTYRSLRHSTEDFSSSECDTDAIPDVATVMASERFFFSSPGSSNSIVRSPVCPLETEDSPIEGGVAISKYSPDPYMDFRLSMQEMVEARQLLNATVHRDYLHELLLCYLHLNPKHTHKFILSAFSDLLVSLTTSRDRPRSPSI